MPDSPQPVPRHSTSPKTPATSPPLSADVKPSPSSKAASPTASPSLPNSWHTQTNYKPQTTSTPLTSEKSPSNPQQYCLRWNNTSNLTNVFDQLLHNESFVDVTLACDGKSIKAHKMVLSACSPYFQSLFFENPCQYPIVILRDVKWSELKSVVEFMYKGEINLAHDEIGPLLNVAEMLKIRGLADVKGDHDAIKLEHSSSLPEIIPVAKQPKITASSDWDLNKIDFLMRNASAVSPASSSTTTSTATTIRNQRKRNSPNGGTAALATTINPSNIANSTGNHTISLSSRNLKNNNGNSSTSNSNSSLPHTDTHSNDDMEIKSVNPIDGLETRSQSSMSEDLPVDASSTPTPPTVRNATLNIPDSGALSSLGGLPHADAHSNDDLEIKPGIPEMIREEERTNYKPQTTSTPLTSEKSPSNPQQYCLRWNNTSNLTNVFDQLLHNESFVDVTLACDGKSIKAHKMVLSACSPYFQSLFFENPCQHPIVILRDVKWSELKSVVEFMYKGEINLAHDEIGPLLNVAEMLKIRGLADVKGDHDAIKLEHSSSLPEIIPVAKQPKITASSDWDLNKIDFLMRNASAVSPASSSTTTSTATTIRNQRKRNSPNGGTAALATTINPSNIANSTGNHTISLSSRNLKNNNGNSSTSNSNSSLPHTDTHSNDDMEIKPVNPIDGLETRSQSSMSEDLPVDASSTPTPPTVRNATLNIPDSGALSSLGCLPHADAHSNDDLEIKPGIPEMIREEERQ